MELASAQIIGPAQIEHRVDAGHADANVGQPVAPWTPECVGHDHRRIRAAQALEAVAKIVTERNNDLSSNRERFIKAVRAPDAYKKVLKEYIDYGCEFRHAADASEQKPAPHRTKLNRSSI